MRLVEYGRFTMRSAIWSSKTGRAESALWTNLPTAAAAAHSSRVALQLDSARSHVHSLLDVVSLIHTRTQHTLSLTQRSSAHQQAATTIAFHAAVGAAKGASNAGRAAERYQPFTRTTADIPCCSEFHARTAASTTNLLLLLAVSQSHITPHSQCITQSHDILHSPSAFTPLLHPLPYHSLLFPLSLSLFSLSLAFPSILTSFLSLTLPSSPPSLVGDGEFHFHHSSSDVVRWPADGR